jgi:hypothetical protein
VTREEFLELPPAVALRVLFDALDEDTTRAIAHMEKIKLPLPPKYDAMIYRQGGIMWASETALEGLLYWRDKYLANNDPKYAEKDRKRAATLDRWIAWRECYPDAVWGGERNEQPVTARPPSKKPTVYPRTGGNGGGQRREAPPPQDDDIDPDSDVPF